MQHNSSHTHFALGLSCPIRFMGKLLGYLMTKDIKKWVLHDLSVYSRLHLAFCFCLIEAITLGTSCQGKPAFTGLEPSLENVLLWSLMTL